MRNSGLPLKPARERAIIVGAGFVALDVILEGNESCTALGGSTGNVMAILGYLGWHAIPVAHVGRDRAAALIRDEFHSLGVDMRFLREEPSMSTPVVYQFNNNGRHEFTFSCPYCGSKRKYQESESRDLSAEVLASTPTANVYYFDRVTNVTLDVAEAYRARDAIVMFEPSAIPQDGTLFERALSLAHIVKYASDRIDDLGRFDLSDVAVEIQTIGEKGLRFRAPSLGDNWVHMPSLDVPHIRDTAGAGDWSSAAMLHHLTEVDALRSPKDLTHNRLYRSLRFGQALAALNCMHTGARGLAHRWAALYAMRTARGLIRGQPDSTLNELPEPQRRSTPTLVEHLIRASAMGFARHRTWQKPADLCCKALAISAP